MHDATAENIGRNQDAEPQHATHKRRLGAWVRAARERLTSSDTGHRGYDLGLLSVYAEARIRFLPADLGMILLAVWLAHSFVAADMLIGWAMAALAGVGARQFVARRLLSEAEAKTPLLQRRARVLFAEGLNGLIWAAAVFPLIAAPQTHASGFLALLLVLRAGVDAIAAATVLVAVYAAIGPAAITLAICVFLIMPASEQAPLLVLLTLAHVFSLALRIGCDALLLKTGLRAKKTMN